MSTPTPTPRPALKATGMRRRHARCLETELAALRARAERAEAEVERLRSDRDCEKRLRKDANEFRENAIERAMKAEADLVALEQSFDDNCRGVVRIADELATERARLDWLLLDVVSRFDDAYYTRATIDAAVKEET